MMANSSAIHISESEKQPRFINLENYSNLINIREIKSQRKPATIFKTLPEQESCSTFPGRLSPFLMFQHQMMS